MTSQLIQSLKSEESKRTLELIEKYSHFDSNLLVYGETGTGKDLFVNQLSEFSEKNLITLNCSDVPEGLLESEWFGYVKGAFTGSFKDYGGKWIQAQKGILFLNNIDELSLNMQAKLLRIIERKKISPLGSNEEFDLDARFVFSADESVKEKKESGEFRKDLFYRISTLSLNLKPLRERRADIMPLIRYFAEKFDLHTDLSKSGEQALLNYSWPGNIREIENFIRSEKFVNGVLSDKSIDNLIVNSSDLLHIEMKKELSLKDMENKYIDFLLKKYRSKKKVADILKISRQSLYNKTRKNEEN